MPRKPGAALLFDIDGTLVHSDPLHLQAFNQAFAPFGHKFDQARFAAELQGRANVDIMARFFPDAPREQQLARMEDKEALFRTLAAEGIAPLPGLVDLLDWADAQGIAVGAVTNAPRANAELLLGALRPRFATLVIGAELPYGKPHPMPYLEGLKALDADPAHTVAFEDSRTGLRSAIAAGIATVGMSTGLGPADLQAAGAVLAAPDYTDAALLALVRRTTLGEP